VIKDGLFKMSGFNKSNKILLIKIFENLGRIEELAKSISFFFTNIYNVESEFGKRKKYATIAKQIIFLVIQRSNSIIWHIFNSIDKLKQAEISDSLKNNISELQSLIKSIENDYEKGKYKGITEKLKEIGVKSEKIKIKLEKNLG
jgi:hypothetical protein